MAVAQTSEEKFDSQKSYIEFSRWDSYQDYVDSYLDHWPANLEEFVMEVDVEDDLTLVSYPNMDHKSGYHIYRATEYIHWRKNKSWDEMELCTIAVAIDYDESNIYIFDSRGFNDRMYECMKGVFPKNFTVKGNMHYITDNMNLYLGEVWSSLFAEKLTHYFWDDKNPHKIVKEFADLGLGGRKQMIRKQLLEQPKFDASINEGICK